MGLLGRGEVKRSYFADLQFEKEYKERLVAALVATGVMEGQPLYR